MFNRRISDMLNSESRRLSSALESVTEESDRRFSDLFNLTTEMFEDQVCMEGQSCWNSPKNLV